MKLQSLSIIFIIIVFPLILVLSYYISLQIDTVTLYNKYNNELIDATNDAMAAFELNTANENLSNVSDSLRTIVDASTNTFINTFSTSLGLSNAHKNEIESYIPSILYTMYDGYYIYSPTRIPVILENTKIEGELVISDGAKYSDEGLLLYKQNESDTTGTTSLAAAMFDTDYVLKSYMPYSATYIDDENIATINYTLDNFMSVSAKLDNYYYTKSGYYIDTNLINSCNISDWENKGQDELKQICESGESVTITLKDGSSIEYVGSENPEDLTKKLTIQERENQLNKYYKEYEELIFKSPRDATIEGEINNKLVQIQTEEVQINNIKAITYYLTNTVFSEWINANLGFVTGENLQTVIDFEHPKEIGYSLENMNEIYHNFDGEGRIFDGSVDPENEDSAFNNHKYNIIKNSIQYNLNLAISSYNNMFEGIEFAMPQISDSEWEEITNKISIVSFAQGLKCGLKTYNGYAVISSTNNEMTVIPEEIYYVEADKFNNEINFYHRIDCKNIRDYSGNFISFKSKEVRYDDVYVGETTSGRGYQYDHKNLACYNCIAQNNYINYDDGTGTKKKIKLRAFLGLETDRDNTEGVDYKNTGTITPNLNNLKKAYYIAIGKERQNLYKTTAYSKNEGIQTVKSSSISWNSNISKAEVTLKYTGPIGIVGNILIDGGGTGKVISTGTQNMQTIEIENNGINGEITCDAGDIEEVFIKYIYK